MAKVKKQEKDDVYWLVFTTVLNLEFKFGHQRWTISQLSRSSGISRPLIYYYFGKSKPQIVLEAVRILGDVIAGLPDKNIEMWKTGHLVEEVLETRQLLAKAPNMIAFYFSRRNDTNEIGNAIRAIETKFMKKLSDFFPDMPRPQLEGFFAVFIGLTFSLNISDDAVKAIIDAVFKT